MLNKEQLTNKIATATNDGFERWKIGTRYFTHRAAELGMTSMIPQQPFNGESKDVVRVDGDIVKIFHIDNRAFYLHNVTEVDYGAESDLRLPADSEFYAGGMIVQRGLDYDIDELGVAISWHDQALERAFDWFKLWMIDRIDAGEMEKILDETKEEFDL